MTTGRRLVLVGMALYLAGYGAFRSVAIERWQRDGRDYVIYPFHPVGRALYYGWRPVAHLDAALTGTGSHLGAHR